MPEVTQELVRDGAQIQSRSDFRSKRSRALLLRMPSIQHTFIRFLPRAKARTVGSAENVQVRTFHWDCPAVPDSTLFPKAFSSHSPHLLHFPGRIQLFALSGVYTAELVWKTGSPVCSAAGSWLSDALRLCSALVLCQFPLWSSQGAVSIFPCVPEGDRFTLKRLLVR